MASFFPSKFKPVYQSDCEPACSMSLFEPPFTMSVSWSWDGDMVDRWLVDTGYGRYRRCFQEHRITGDNLLSLNQDHLRQMGVRDRGEAAELVWNIHQLSRIRRPTSTDELPGPPYNHYRALCFGEQTAPLTSCHSSLEPISYRNYCSPDPVTLKRIAHLAGDPFGWFERNRPHPLN